MDRFERTRRLRRTLVGLVALLFLLVGSPGRAAAHGGDSGSTSNYRATVTSPGAEGLRWEITGGDALVELTNGTGVDVVVLGYEGEPYLWFAPGQGVLRNVYSPASYLNQTRYGDVRVPEIADASAEPEWQLVATTQHFDWHDHRVHWMSTTPPPAVAEQPGRQHLINVWSIPVRVGADGAVTEVAARGVLRWIPDARWWPPLLVLGLTAVVVVGGAALLSRPRGDRWPVLARVAAVLVGAVGALDVARVVDDVRVRADTGGERAAVLAAGIGGLVLIALALWRAWVGDARAFAALFAGSLVAMLFFGGTAFDELSAPVIETDLPLWLRRWTVAASYAALVPGVLAVAIAARWRAGRRPPAVDEPAPESAGGS